ncbi:MAG: hypothetical protein M1834_006771 [Cirrosporium novae-zelandiae]|nr:MAG: hypothetical protein M1834_006771 [Cirrosporium novae-zelandiae]
MATAKPTLARLKTPKTGAFPSEIPRSANPALIEFIKREDDLKTPITPPTAYVDFLKALSPAMPTPLTANQSFDFSDKASDKSTPTPTSQPSTASSCSCSCENRKTPINTVPPSPFARPRCGRTPTALRRLRIPQSPAFSPATDSPLSSAVLSPFSPQEWALVGKTRIFDAPRSATTRPVSVRQVVTRTITYKRNTPALEPAPKGKRKRVD